MCLIKLEHDVSLTNIKKTRRHKWPWWDLLSHCFAPPLLISFCLPWFMKVNDRYPFGKMHADDDKNDNTRKGSTKFLTSSLTLHMKGLNISEVSKSYKPQNVWNYGLWLRNSNLLMYFNSDTSCIQIFLRTSWIRHYWQLMLSSLFLE